MSYNALPVHPTYIRDNSALSTIRFWKDFAMGVKFEDGSALFSLLPFKIKLFAPEFMKDSDKNNFCESYLKSVVHNGCEFKLN